MILYSILTPPSSTKSSHRCNCRMIIETSFCLLLNNIKTASPDDFTITITLLKHVFTGTFMTYDCSKVTSNIAQPILHHYYRRNCLFSAPQNVVSCLDSFSENKFWVPPKHHFSLISKNRTWWFSCMRTSRWPKVCSQIPNRQLIMSRCEADLILIFPKQNLKLGNHIFSYDYYIRVPKMQRQNKV